MTITEATIYTQPSCGPCIGQKMMLKSQNVPFFELNIQEEEDGKRVIQDLGYTGTPVVVVRQNDVIVDHWYGVRPDKIAEWRAELISSATEEAKAA